MLARASPIWDLMARSSPLVLLVGDDPVLRADAECAAAEAGFKLACAPNVPCAEAIVDNMDTECLACALVDDLPERGGLELMEWLNRRHPALAVVLITASTEHGFFARSLQARVCALLPKPADPSALRSAVAQASEITAKRRAFTEMRYQVEQAGRLQKTILERMLRRGDVSLEYRFYPRNECSGDFLAFHPLPGGRDLFLMSDAAGHDLHAVQHSAYFHGVLSGMLRSGGTLREVLREHNLRLLEQPTGEVSSMAVSALVVDRGSGCMSACNYGGPPPAFIDSDGWVQTLGTRASSPLGWLEDATQTEDRAGIPRGPVWMWTDGLEEQAESIHASPLSAAYALLERSSEVAGFLRNMRDDILVARIWPGASAQAPHADYPQPLIAERYGKEMIGSIDRLQQRWVRSLQLALPVLDQGVSYDLALCAREAVLNALKHGCSAGDTTRFQVVYEHADRLLRVRVSDPGSGYDFDFPGHVVQDRIQPVAEHRGLMLIHTHASRVVMARQGAEMTLEFPVVAGGREKVKTC